MDSYYGGQSGKSFEIKTIFANKKEMLADLNLRWQSPIGVSDFVVISYGLPGTGEDKFADNQEEDIAEFGRTYNSTLWQKIYTEKKVNGTDPLSGIEVMYIAGDQGLGYRLIASMTGNTPQFQVYGKILHSYESPRWTLDSSSVDKPKLTIYLPMAQVVSFEEKTGLIEGDEPYLEWDITTNGDVYNQYDSNGNAIPDGKDRPILKIGLPPTWKWGLEYKESNADQSPTAELVKNGDTQVLKLSLPQSQVFQQAVSHTLKANEPPTVNINYDNINNPVIHFYIPAAQQLQKGNTTWLDANQKPSFEIDSEDSNNPILNFSLPQSQILSMGVNEVLNADQDPVVTFNSDDPNNAVISFKLPQSQTLSMGTNEVLNADQKPVVTFNDDDPNNAVISFKLPQSQVMSNPETAVIAPTKNPSVILAGTANNPKLNFSLPRAVKFYYGGLLGEKTAGDYTLSVPTVQSYEVGDYYVNTNTGFIYLVTNKESENVTFTYTACLQAPMPSVNPIVIDPYSEDGSIKNNPSVSSSFANETEETGWTLNFSLPKLPNFSATHEFLGSAEEGDITVTPNAKDNINLHIKLPGASRIFAGNVVKVEGSHTVSDAILGNALFGDLYLNTEAGTVFKLGTDGIWHYQNQGLKGPPGPALNIVRSYRITVTETMTDSLDNGVQYIIDNYIDDKGDPLPYSSDEIFAVTWVDGTSETSYWYFYTEDGKWSRVQLAGAGGGAIIDSIENSYLESVEPNLATDKIYSVDYVNKLIGGDISQDSNITTLSKSQIYALSSWGTFEEAKNGNWWPGPGSIQDNLMI